MSSTRLASLACSLAAATALLPAQNDYNLDKISPAILGGSLSIGDDPGSAAAHAHRFTVVVFQPRTDALAALVESAVERNKPAHTVHEICFVSAGLRVGVTSFVGLGTTLGDVDRTSPFVVDQSPLGTRSVLGVRGASVKLGTFLGGARIGKSTHLL